MSKNAILRDRAAMFARARSFFSARHILEVDCPLLSASASVDAHIDLIATTNRYLHSSPEYGMKRLLADGIGDIYQISHVFRENEIGPKHNPEFMMAEWYRLGISFEALIEETLDFIRLFLGDLPSATISYREALQRYAGIDYRTESDESLNITLGTLVEPQLGQEELTVLAFYPASQAALARTRILDGESVAERFEVYYKGVELCNGYHELADPVEQRHRLEEANATRTHKLPLDEHFLKALEKGLPDCCGVAVGIDRLMMLRHKASCLADVIPFSWEMA